MKGSFQGVSRAFSEIKSGGGGRRALRREKVASPLCHSEIVLKTFLDHAAPQLVQHLSSPFCCPFCSIFNRNRCKQRRRSPLSCRTLPSLPLTDNVCSLPNPLTTGFSYTASAGESCADSVTVANCKGVSCASGYSGTGVTMSCTPPSTSFALSGCTGISAHERGKGVGCAFISFSVPAKGRPQEPFENSPRNRNGRGVGDDFVYLGNVSLFDSEGH